MTKYEGPLTGLDQAIERVITPAQKMSDARPPEHVIARNHRGQMVHYRRRSDGTFSEQVVSHNG
jgi:hypothetical protein